MPPKLVIVAVQISPAKVSCNESRLILSRRARSVMDMEDVCTVNHIKNQSHTKKCMNFKVGYPSHIDCSGTLNACVNFGISN